MAHSATPSKWDETFFRKKLSPSTMLPLYRWPFSTSNVDKVEPVDRSLP